jgi:starch-binding outer membrane protein SusE/F
MYDSYSDTWRAVVTLKTGDMKIRQNNEWNVNYGDKTKDGILDTENDNNIPVTAGNYLVIVDFKDLSYTIEQTDIWGVVGSGYNDWGGAGPDAPFTPDFSTEGVYYIKSVTLIDGQIKFRKNNDWTVNYGDKTLDGILDTENDNNIPVTAGVYDIVLDFSNPDSPKYTMTKK